MGYSQFPSDTSGGRSFKTGVAFGVGAGLLVGGIVALSLFPSTLHDTSAESLIALPTSQLGRPAPLRGQVSVRSTNPDAPIKLGINGFGRIGRQVMRIAMEREDFVIKHINSPMSPEYMKYQLEHDTVHGRFDGTVELTDGGLKVNGLDITLSATRDPTEIPWSKTGVEYVCESTGAFTTTEGCMKHVEGGAKKVIISAPAKDADTPTIVIGVNQEDYKTVMKGKLTGMAFRVPTVDVSVVDLTCELEKPTT